MKLWQMINQGSRVVPMPDSLFAITTWSPQIYYQGVRYAPWKGVRFSSYKECQEWIEKEKVNLFTKRVVRIQVVSENQNQILVQTHQIIKQSGSIRVRGWCNISKTIEDGESPFEAAIRGLQEELRLTVDKSRVCPLGGTEEVKPSPSSGEMSRYLFYDFALELLDAEKASVPLSVDEGEVITHFQWRDLYAIEIG